MQRRRPAFLLRASRYLAVPFAALIMGAVYAQALFDIVPVREPVSRLLAFNIEPVARQLEDLRVQQRATAIATTNYALNAWFSFYMPDSAPVIQLNERFRYLDQPPISRSLLSGPLLYVTEVRNDQSAFLAQHFETITPLTRIDRTRGGAIIDRYAVYRINGVKDGGID
jgi:hypothetical protein